MRKTMLVAILSLVSALGMTVAAAELKVGDLAPNFTLVGSDGKTHVLADYRGTTIVLAWFPKAFTKG